MSSKNLGKSSVKTVWRNVAVAVFALCFALLGLGVTLIPTHAADDDPFITIGEIYDNPANMQKLYDALRGATSGTTYAQIAHMAEQKTNAATFRELNKGRDIKVTFGGQEWHAVYLSQTNEANPRPILTLWLAESIGNSIWGVEHTKMYTDSTVRAYINNPVNQMQDFLTGGSYAGVVVTPKNMSWQASMPNPNAWSYNAGYENYNSDNAITQDSNYGAWKDDKVWLASLYETGATGGDAGLWQLSAEQRVDSLTSGEWQYNYSWLRNAIIEENGFSSTPVIGYQAYIGYQHIASIYRDNMKVRPALHIDLSAAALAANLDEVPDALGTVIYDGDNHDVAVVKPAWYRDAMQIVYRHNGTVTDTVTTVGEYTAEITLGQLTKTVPFTITSREVTWSGTVTPQNRVYNRERTVALSTAVTLDNAVAGDDIKVTLSAVVADKNAGDALPLTVTAVLSGTAKDNYLLTNPVNTSDYTVNISQRTIVVDGITVNSKVYDRTPQASLNTTGVNLGFGGLLDGDDLTVAVSGTFSQVNVGTDIPVALDVKLVGDDAANYKIDLANSQQEATGDIAKRFITVTINDQTVKVGDPLKLIARVSSGSIASGDNADDVYTLAIKLPTDAEFDVNNLPAGEYTVTGAVAGGDTAKNYEVNFANTGKYTVLTAAAWDALQTKDDDKTDNNNYWVVIVIVIAVAAFIGALVGIGLVVRSHDRTPQPAKEKKTKPNKKDKSKPKEKDDNQTADVTPTTGAPVTPTAK